MENFDDMSNQHYSRYDNDNNDDAKDKQIKDMMNRPVKDPRSEALRNI